MAGIDALLRAMDNNAMELLALEPGHPPRLRRANAWHAVGSAPLDAAMIARLLGEIAPPEHALPDPEVNRHWQHVHTAGGARYTIQAFATPEGWTARVTPGTASEPPVAGDYPATDRSASEAPRASPIPAVKVLLERMVAEGASDLHLTSGEVPRLRIDGDLDGLPEYAAPTTADLERLVSAITPEANRRQFETSNDTDFAYELPGRGRFRVNLFRDRKGVGAVLRHIPERIPTVDELGLPDAVRKLAHLSKGLVLVTGPTGSGKSTTLAAIVDLVNRTRRDHIITIEDPIEFVHPSRRCLVHQREVGVHTGSFKQALRAALREDPDVVLVGEMRDLETVSIAIETAETGHLVFGTLHTTTAASTVERLVDQFPGDRQAQIRMMLADSLKAVIAQTLLKKIGGGRVAAFEILVSIPAVANLVREGKTFQIASAMQTGRQHGMALLNDALLSLVERDLVAPEEAYLKAVDKDGLVQRFRAAGIRLDLALGTAAEG